MIGKIPIIELLKKRLPAEHNFQIGIIIEPGGICPPGSFAAFSATYRNLSSLQQEIICWLLSHEFFIHQVVIIIYCCSSGI